MASYISILTNTPRAETLSDTPKRAFMLLHALGTQSRLGGRARDRQVPRPTQDDATSRGFALRAKQLPALLLGKPSVIVSPLIALMKDQCDHMERVHIDAAGSMRHQGAMA